MQIPTKFLGVIECDQQDVIHFSKGLPGFEDEKEFILLPLENDSPFAMLQSIQRQEVGFVVAYPFIFKQDYAFDISEEDKNDLAVEQKEDIVAYSIVTLKEPFKDSTMNLLAPVVINNVKKTGKQIVLQDSEHFPLRFPLGALEGSAT